MKDLQKLVVKQFGSESAQKQYLQHADKGLWPSEEVLIDKYFEKGSKVLDLGCGTGRTTIPLKKKGYDVIGVDITPEMIENAKKVAKKKDLDIDYKVGDATNLDFKDESFDCLLFSNNGWTQIPGSKKRKKAMKEMYRVLKPDGLLIFSTHVRSMKGFLWFWTKQWIKLHLLKPLGFDVPEEEFGDRFFQSEGGKKLYEEPQYIHIPHVPDVLEMLEEVGFEVLENSRSNKISEKENHEFSPMIYVCKK